MNHLKYIELNGEIRYFRISFWQRIKFWIRRRRVPTKVYECDYSEIESRVAHLYRPGTSK